MRNVSLEHNSGEPLSNTLHATSPRLNSLNKKRNTKIIFIADIASRGKIHVISDRGIYSLYSHSSKRVYWRRTELFTSHRNFPSCVLNRAHGARIPKVKVKSKVGDGSCVRMASGCESSWLSRRFRRSDRHPIQALFSPPYLNRLALSSFPLHFDCLAIRPQPVYFNSFSIFTRRRRGIYFYRRQSIARF